MKTKVTLKTIGWLFLITLGVIHFLNWEDLSVLNSGLKGFIYNLSVVAALGLVAFSSSPKNVRESKTGMTLVITGIILFIVGLIWSGLKGYDAILLFIVFLSMIMLITADFIALHMEATSKNGKKHIERKVLNKE